MIKGIQFSELIVTSLGITRESKSLTYADQEMNNENLSLTRETNLVSLLAGIVAGVQVTTASGSSLGVGKYQNQGIEWIERRWPSIYHRRRTDFECSFFGLGLRDGFWNS